MRNKVFSLLCSVIFILSVWSCKEETPPICFCDCSCTEDETCISNICYPNKDLFKLGGSTIYAPNGYIGTTNCNQCVDTLVFVIDSTKALEFDRFGLYIFDPQVGVKNVAGSYTTIISDNEFALGPGSHFCFQDGEAWYADMHFLVQPDSVRMQLLFYNLNSEPGIIEDTCIVNFYKQL